jgi:hypothetical protein
LQARRLVIASGEIPQKAGKSLKNIENTKDFPHTKIPVYGLAIKRDLW